MCGTEVREQGKVSWMILLIKVAVTQNLTFLV